MSRSLVILLAFTFTVRGGVRSLTRRQAVQIAIQQNPDLTLARLDEEKARQAVRSARDPFFPRLVVGSGLAYSNGFPMSIEGSAPSIVQAQARAFIFNRPQSYQIAVAKENVRGATLTVASKRDEVAYRVASLFVDAERVGRVIELARKDAESQQKVLETVQALVKEGRALPLAEKQAALNVARARQLFDALEDDRIAAQSALAMAIGLHAEDRVQPTEGQRPSPTLPPSEDLAIQNAVEANTDLRR